MRVSDWSSDVCSSDLVLERQHRERRARLEPRRGVAHRLAHSRGDALLGSELGDNHPLAAEQLRLRRQHFRGRRGSGLYHPLSRRHLRDEHRRLPRLTPPAPPSEPQHPIQSRPAPVTESASPPSTPPAFPSPLLSPPSTTPPPSL